MENVQMDEETRPLAQPMRRVAEAYTTNDRINNMKKYSFWVLAFIAFLVFSAGSSSGEDKKHKRAKKLRNKAETMPEVEVQKMQDINKKIELNEKYAQLNDAHAAFEDSEDASLVNDEMEAEDELEREVDRVFDGVAMAEEEEIESNNSMLSSAVETMQESVKFYLGKVFGIGEEEEYFDDDDIATSEESADVKLSEEQLDMIAKKISDKLKLDVDSEFREKADAVKKEKVVEIDQVVAEDRDAQMDARQIADDVKEARDVVVEDLKDEIDDAANKVKDEIPERVKKIRSEVVQEVTGKKLEDIENKKRAKKERKQKLAEKFKEMREEAEAKEAAAKKRGRYDGRNSDDKKRRVKKPKLPLASDDRAEESEPGKGGKKRRVKKPKGALLSDKEEEESDKKVRAKKPAKKRPKEAKESDDSEDEDEESYDEKKKIARRDESED